MRNWNQMKQRDEKPKRRVLRNCICVMACWYEKHKEKKLPRKYICINVYRKQIIKPIKGIQKLDSAWEQGKKNSHAIAVEQCKLHTADCTHQKESVTLFSFYNPYS